MQKFFFAIILVASFLFCRRDVLAQQQEQWHGLSVRAPQADSSIKYWIEFTDKNISPSDFHPGNSLFDQTRTRLNTRAITRRERALGTNDITKIITIEDAPLAASYLDSLRALGIAVINTSRWQNAVSAKLSPSQVSILTKYNFIKRIHPVGQSILQALAPNAVNLLHVVQSIPSTPTVQYCGYDSIIYHYGNADEQLRNINVLPLHSMGFDGTGVVLGVLDDGFRWRVMQTTDMHDVIGEYDFVFKDSITANQADDDPSQDLHGSAVLSTCTGFLPDVLVGPAYNAMLILAKTEDVRSETPREEDNYAAALEWMEGLGVDITSSSLGYRTFDSGFVSYTYNDLDGHTAISSRSAERAANLGVLVCTASGNDFQTDPPSLLAPSDADSILSCGAIQFDDTIASFSSNGPSADGRIKPDICAPGVDVATYEVDNTPSYDTGTSLATPLVSGACALIKQTHPEASSQQIRNAVLRTGIRFGAAPDNTYGYGRIDAYNAALSLGTIIGGVKLSKSDTIYSVCVPIAANNKITNARIVYSTGTGNLFLNKISLSLVTDSLYYSGEFPPITRGTFVRYYIEATDGADTVTLSPRGATDSVYHFYIGDTIIAPPSAVSDRSEEPTLNIFPNPSANSVMVASNNPELQTATLIDDLGRTIFKFLIPAGEQMIRLQVDGIGNGTYILKVVAHSGISSFHSVVVAK